ncbi:MAG TPA: hypothetical protein VG165_09080 [Solirubrobacteraceae bacterium]|jgi:hypothetical protein|nr:hypothetical protein [Solirubrobacteraceae bacterium]
MIPYDGTPIKDHLAREGRLPGDVLNPDYDFLDPRLAVFCRETLRGITAASNAVLFDVVEQLADECQAGTSGSIDSGRLRLEAASFVSDLLRERNGFVSLNQRELLRVLAPDVAAAAG